MELNKFIASLSKNIIKFAGTPTGQRIIYFLKNSTPSLWYRSERLRKFIVQPAQNNTIQYFSNHMLESKIVKVLSGKNPKKIGYTQNFQGVLIFTPDLGIDKHSITQLALEQEIWITQAYPVRVYLSTHSRVKSEKKSTTVYFKSGEDSSKFAAIFHLGNNYESITALDEMLTSKNLKDIAIMHDLNLIDLFEFYGDANGLHGFVQKLIEKKLGAYGIELFERYRNKENLSISDRANLYDVFLDVVRKNSDYQILHSANFELLNELKVSNFSSMLRTDLPLQFAPGSYKINPYVNYQSSSSTIVISGRHIHENQLKTVLFAIKELLLDVPQLEILIVGGAKTVYRDMVKNDIKLKPLISKSRYIRSDSEIDWKFAHKQGSVAVMLGVGINGESSGSIRDYLSFGMKVVSDEISLCLDDHPNYFRVKANISSTELSKIIKQVMSKSLLQFQFGREFTDQKYKKLLLDLLGNRTAL
jgi:hypothetical protein